MARISLQVIDGNDKGRCFVELPTPVTMGREDGNTLRLNDDRVSRFHAKILEDQGEVVLTDLESTNGTRVNGEVVQLRILRLGDRIGIGRSTLVFGRSEEIEEFLRKEGYEFDEHGEVTKEPDERDSQGTDLIEVDGHESASNLLLSTPPELPRKLSPAQAAQMSEVIEYVHRVLSDSIDQAKVNSKQMEVHLNLPDWHRLQALQSVLARYTRSISEPAGE